MEISKKKYNKRNLQTTRRSCFTLKLRVSAREFVESLSNQEDFDSIFAENDTSDVIYVQTLKIHKKGFFQQWKTLIESIEATEKRPYKSITGIYLIHSKREKTVPNRYRQEIGDLNQKILKLEKIISELKLEIQGNSKTNNRGKKENLYEIERLNKLNLKKEDEREKEENAFKTFRDKIAAGYPIEEVYIKLNNDKDMYNFGAFLTILESNVSINEKKKIMQKHFEQHPNLKYLQNIVLSLCGV